MVDSRASQSTAARLTAPRAARQAERRGGGRSDVRAQWRDGAGESGCGSRAAPARWHLQALAELGGEGRAGRQRQPTGRSDAARRELRQCTAAREPACMKRGAPNGLEAANAQWDGRFRSDLEEEMRSRRRARDGRRSQNPPGSLPQDDHSGTAGGLWRGVVCFRAWRERGRERATQCTRPRPHTRRAHRRIRIATDSASAPPAILLVRP